MAGDDKFTNHGNKEPSKDVTEAVGIIAHFLSQVFQFFHNLQTVRVRYAEHPKLGSFITFILLQLQVVDSYI
jgi:hypothetical protein